MFSKQYTFHIMKKLVCIEHTLVSPENNEPEASKMTKWEIRHDKI